MSSVGVISPEVLKADVDGKAEATTLLGFKQLLDSVTKFHPRTESGRGVNFSARG